MIIGVGPVGLTARILAGINGFNTDIIGKKLARPRSQLEEYNNKQYNMLT